MKTIFERPDVTQEQFYHKLSLTLIVITSFLIRMIPYWRYDHLLKAFDPYIQFEIANHILNDGFTDWVNWVDQQTWYPMGRAMGQSSYIGVPLSSVIFYKILHIFGIKIDLMTISFITPAILGTLSVLAIYFLGKEVQGKRAGLLTALLLAVTPAHIQRSIAGFFDNESIGILLLIVTYVFFVRGLKTNSMVYGLLAGIALGFLGISWGAAKYAFDFLALYVIVLILVKKHSSRLLAAYGPCIVVGTTISAMVPRIGPQMITKIDHAFPIGALILLTGILAYEEFVRTTEKRISRKFTQYFTILAGLGFTGLMLALWALDVLGGITGKFISVLFPNLREEHPLIASVAEHLPLNWANMFVNIYIMTFLIPVGVLYTFRRKKELDIFALLFTLSSLYFASSMVRLLLILAPAAALLSGIALDSIITPFALAFQERLTLSRRRLRVSVHIGRDFAGVAILIIMMMMFFNIWHGLRYTSRNLSAPEIEIAYEVRGTPETQSLGDWQEALGWFRHKGPNTVVLSWWDYGYWIRVMGNVTTLADNATWNNTQIGNIGAFMVSSPELSIKIAKLYDVDYVVINLAAGNLNAGSDLAKVQWMIKIGAKYSSLADYEVTDYYIENATQPEETFTTEFWNSTIYQLALYNLGSLLTEMQQTFITLKNAPTVEILPKGFREEYTTKNNWVRIYSINYDDFD
ncbi:MAG: STT3 domain-containing protein [Candidatus Hodarchaeota archaeon]